MKGKTRPHGRRTMLRALGVAALSAAALAAETTTAVAAAPVAPAIQTFANDASRGGAFAAGPDGATWSFELLENGQPVVSRYGRSKRLSRVDLPVLVDGELTPLTPQADGGMAFLAGRWRGDDLTRLRIDASGRRASAVALPRGARTADAFAIAASGEVWWIDSCADSLYRWRPGMRPARVQLPPANCEAGGSSALTVGPDGAVWLANMRQGRIVRRDARGRVRQWHVTQAGDAYLGVAIVTDPRGGSAAFTDGSPWGESAGLITRSGRVVRTPVGNAAFGPGGMLWRTAAGRLVWRNARGESEALALASRVDPIAVAIGRDGTPWFTTGRYQAPPSSETWFDDIAIGTVHAGAFVSWPAIEDGGPLRQFENAPPLTLGGDGALWTRAYARWNVGRVVRIVPPGLRTPRKPVARVTGLLARNGRTVVLQVRCAAERGRFCRGTVGLGGSAKAVRYVAPGQSGAAVSLTLTRRAAQRLRRRGALQVGAQVSSAGGGTTRATVRLRR